MANIAWLYNNDTAATYVLDTNIISLQFADMNRNWTVNDLYSDGAIITGTGSLKAGQFQITRRFKKSGANSTAWDTVRNTLMAVMATPKNQTLYLYITDSNGVTMRQRIYPTSKSGETYSSYRISGEVSFTFQMEKAYLYNTTANSTTYNPTTAQQETFTITNLGLLPSPPSFTFTPTGSFSSLNIQLAAGNYGFTLLSSFVAGQPIVFDCATGIVTVNGVITAGIQTAGSVFSVAPGANLIYIIAAAGALVASWPERYVL